MPVAAPFPSGPPAGVVTIPAGLPFLDTLAAALDRLIDPTERAADPLAVTRATILLPTRRACRALRDALLRHADGRAALLPRIQPLGDLEEDDALLPDLASLTGGSRGGTGGDGSGDDARARDTAALLALPPPIPPLTRQLLLCRLIQARDPEITPAQAARLAVELARLLDQIQAEGCDIANLADLVPATSDLADHWHQVLAFLSIVTETWPTILAAHGAVDPAAHRKAVLEAVAAAWQRTPPADPIIAAGTTGTDPATAGLLAVIATLPRGLVILPGLDQDLDAASWQALDDSHPQAGLKRLLERLGLPREAVAPFPQTAPGTGRPAAPSPAPGTRVRLLSEAMRPAATTDAWRRLVPAAPATGPDPAADLSDALDGLTLIDAPSPREEAATLALAMREALETPGRTAALITPDRTLARRVAAGLARWGLSVNDSAGLPLSQTPPGLFLRLVAEAAASHLAPVPLMALLHHPLTAAGQSPVGFHNRARLLDRRVLRGPRPAPGLAGLFAALEAAGARDPSVTKRLHPWLERLADRLEPLVALMARPTVALADLLDGHLAVAERLADAFDPDNSRPIPGPLRLWAGDAGEAAAAFAVDLAEAAPALTAMIPARYPAFLNTLMHAHPVRPRRDTHPRLSIWGPLEARLLTADLVLLGGLNEGTWPALPDTGPWMSRPMRAAFGLPLPERRLGLAAHDVVQALATPQVIASRAVKAEGTPTVPARWLTRLATVAEAAGLGPAWTAARHRGHRLLSWAEALDQPPGPPRRCPPPAPRPPVAARPRQLSVTRVETWMRDPYAIYADRILGLRELDPLDADPTRAEYGALIHKILEQAARRWPAALPADYAQALVTLGREVFAQALDRPGVRAFWWPRFERIAAWVADQEAARRTPGMTTLAEISGRLEIAGPAGPFALTATADRIDRLPDGTLAILDYKTGHPPSKKEVAAGFAPQLPLEAAMAAADAFEGVAAAPVSELTFWKLSGGRVPGLVVPATDDPTATAAEARAGLTALIAAFDRAETPYLARPHPGQAPRFSPYQHLARVKEWAGETAADDEDDSP